NGCHIQEVPAKPSTIGRGRKESNVPRQGAQVPRMVGQAFQLKGNGPDGPIVGVHLRSRQAFQVLAISPSMGDGRITRRRLDLVKRTFMGPVEEGFLYTPVLVTQGNFQVKHVLPMALEAEMAGFNDAGVNGPNRHLENLVALDLVKVHQTDRRYLLGIFCLNDRPGEPDRLEPGMALGPQAELFGDLP